MLVTDRVRIDRLVVERGLAPTREKARRLVLAGEVLVNEAPVTKAGTLVDVEAALRLRNAPPPYVGRGGEKLAGALQDLRLDVARLSGLDVGASTGGFTDCLLQHGACRVTAVDVGKGQLDWKLRSDPRVHIIEGVNARHMTPEDFLQPFEPFDMATIDVSFISLDKILPAVAPLVRDGGFILALVKPQFEQAKGEVGAGGIVSDPALRQKAIDRVTEAASRCGLKVEGGAPSRLPGMEGNREYFLLLRRPSGGAHA